MDKSTVAIVYFIISLILGAILCHVTMAKKKHMVDLTASIVIGIFMNVAYLLSLFIEDVFVLRLIYTVILILEAWILFLFMRYAYEHSGLDLKYKKNRGRWGVIFLAVDNLFLVLNLFTEWFFKYESVQIKDIVYIAAKWSPFYVIHWLACVGMSVIIAMILMRHAMRIAGIYRGRYVVGAITFMVGFFCELACRFFTGYMNMWSLPLVSVGIICFYYMFAAYPMIRNAKMKTYAINEMSEPVLMFDYNNRLQIYNKAAVNVLGVDENYPMEKYIRENELYYTPNNHTDGEKKNKEFTRTKFLSGRCYLIHGQELWDEKERFIGTLFTYADITGQEKLKEEATLYATRDQLTGLWNRDYFFEMVTKTLHDNPDEEFIMVVSDVYQFKMFNEILGINAGDDLLLGIAQAYRERCKRLWVFSRISGDRFGLLMPRKDFDEETFMSFVRGVFKRKHYELKVHCYVGVYEIIEPNVTAESMYNRAYMALESIKGDLDKDIAYYHEEIRNKRIFETTTVDELDRALLNNEFEIYLQPQIVIDTRKVVSAEALIRWNKPGRGIVPPGEFIPIFENNGMIAKLDYHVWELACRQLHIWKAEGFEERSVSVNISAKDFYLADLYDSLIGLVERYNINPKNLKLEITETAFVLDVEKQMALVKRLQAYGFVIEIDDFGSGYSSLNSLKDISVDVLKMDMKFFEKTDETGRAEKIVRSVVELANELKMPVIAEGVETAEDLQMLKRVGCQMVQGYYFSKPISVAAYEEFLKDYEYGNMEEIMEKVRNKNQVTM